MEPERERKPSAVSPPGKVEQSGPPARWRNRARGWLAPSADLALAPRRGEKTVLPQSYPAPAPGAARRPYSARTCRLPSRRWFACSRPPLPPVGLRIGRASGEASPNWSRFRAFLCCHSNRYPVRRKPGTDTKFPAQFAGNWLSVPGFAPRERYTWLCLPKTVQHPVFGGLGRPSLLSFLRYIDILTRHARVSRTFRSRHARGPLRLLLRAGWKSRIVRRHSGSARSRGGPRESDQRGTGHRRPVRRTDRRPRRVSLARAGHRTVCADGREARVPPVRQEGIALRIGDQIRLNVKLELGQSSQSVEVNAQASLLETASGSVSFHVSRPQLETLPLDGRNFIPLDRKSTRLNS